MDHFEVTDQGVTVQAPLVLGKPTEPCPSAGYPE